MNYFIGIDIGTTHTKAVIVDEHASVIKEIKAGYPTLQDLPGYSEQEPLQVFNAVVDVLKQAVTIVGPTNKISCVSFSAAMHSLMAVGANSKPLTRLLTWADIRSNTYTDELHSLGIAATIYEQTGTPVHPMSPLCKIAWIRNEQPGIFADTYKFVSIKEYVLHRFSGEWVVDYSIASSTGLFNSRKLAWSDEAMLYAGITNERLSKPVTPTYAINQLTEECLSLTGLKQGTIFIVGAGDGCLANLGSGAVLDNEAAITIGTSGAVRKFSQSPFTNGKQQLFNYLVDDTVWLCGGGINNGGNVLKWFAGAFMDSSFSSTREFEDYMQSAASIPAGSDGLIFLPYIYGERAPIWDANAKGVFFGIGPQHTKAHFMRAVMEGVCFSLLQVLKLVDQAGSPIENVYASGGFTDSVFWLQMLADVIDKKTILSFSADASSMGAIFMGMRALGKINQWKDVKSFIPTGKTYLPDQATQEKYMKNFAVYEGMYEKLKDDFRRL